MFCKKCGFSNQDDAVFCQNCGEKLIPVEPEVNNFTPIENNVPPVKDNSGFATASLILGIISLISSFCCCSNIVTAVLAIVFGIMGRKSSKSTFATVGLILAIVSLVFTLISFVLFFAFGFIDTIDTQFFSEDFFNEGIYF